MTESNQSSSQRDRRNKVKEVIKDKKEEGDKGAPKELIIDIMTDKYDMEEDKVEYALNKLGRENNDVIEPQRVNIRFYSDYR